LGLGLDHGVITLDCSLDTLPGCKSGVRRKAILSLPGFLRTSWGEWG
jgi:hypothetical protein